jgi:hypothetical protein
MLELGTGENIHMFEVQVIDRFENEIAASKPSFQSSTFKHFNASRAVDGDISTFSHTDVSVQDDPSSVWWKVALGDEFRIKSVKIKNRYCGNSSDLAGCLCRLTDATVSLVDSEGTAVATQSVGNTCGKQDLLMEDFIPPTVSLSPTASSAPSTGPVEGFTFVGEGQCLDSVNNQYSWFMRGYQGINDNDCMVWCSQVQHPDFIGVHVLYFAAENARLCFCLFSGGLPGDVGQFDYDPVAFETRNLDGVGPIESFEYIPGASCYQYTHCFQLKTQLLIFTTIPCSYQGRCTNTVSNQS